MKIKLDENIPASLAGTLDPLGHDVDTVAEEGLSGAADPVVWAATQGAGQFLISQDLDLSDIRAFPPGTHAGILIVRLSEPSRTALVERVRMLFTSEDVESWRGHLVIATDMKVRVRRPHLTNGSHSPP